MFSEIYTISELQRKVGVMAARRGTEGKVLFALIECGLPIWSLVTSRP
jgi:hypothetical protein